ncbi:MAG: bifunctional riboflavin kinase/FAD synthetase [Gammaproteobacteria bacterium]|nr:bifunctional riboflavin kinase/FAD synthetase [Gammaproteobacteria bacterium]
MKLIRGLKNFSKLTKPCVLTIGNFDGVHLAHQKILQQVVQAAKKIDAISVVMIFEPTPQEFFLGKKAPARLTSLREKLSLFRVQEVDIVWLLPFNKQLAELSGEEFIQDVLLDKLNLKQLIMGDDFQFGKNRSGDFALLQKFAAQHDFELTRTAEIVQGAQRVSSTRVRECLVNGDLTTVEQLLARPYSITGRVLHGAKRGRQLGFPTANLGLKRKVVPLSGVYAVKVLPPHSNRRPYMGVANIGTRPTVNGTRTLLEVHLFDFNQEIYGQLIEVEFCHKLRDEQRFASLDELKAHIAQDVIDAKQFFN